MEPKPDYLGQEFASIFGDESVVRAYRHRPGYPPALFPVLAGLMAPEGPRALLDAGCGPGPVARGMLPFVDRVDAVDVSARMLDAGRRLPGGDDPRLRWICGPMAAALGRTTSGKNPSTSDFSWTHLPARIVGT